MHVTIQRPLGNGEVVVVELTEHDLKGSVTFRKAALEQAYQVADDRLWTINRRMFVVNKLAGKVAREHPHAYAYVDQLLRVACGLQLVDGETMAKLDTILDVLGGRLGDDAMDALVNTPTGVAAETIPGAEGSQTEPPATVPGEAGL